MNRGVSSSVILRLNGDTIILRVVGGTVLRTSPKEPWKCLGFGVGCLCDAILGWIGRIHLGRTTTGSYVHSIIICKHNCVFNEIEGVLLDIYFVPIHLLVHILACWLIVTV